MSPALRWRPILATVILVLAGLAVVIMGFVGWVVGTAPGARWAFSLAGGAIPNGALTAERIDGVLASPLRLTGVRLRTDTLDVSLRRLVVRWELPSPWRPVLDVRALEMDSLVVRRLLPPAPAGPVTLPELRLPLRVRLRDARLRTFASFGWRDTVGARLAAATLAGEMGGDRWRLERLSLRDSAFTFEVSGLVRTSGDWPLRLDLDWSVTPAAAASAAGPPPVPRLAGTGRLEGSLVAPHLEQRLTEPAEARLDATAEMDRGDLSRAPRHFRARLEMPPVDPSRFAPGAPPVRVGGTLSAEGSLDRFAASLSAGLRSDSLGDLDLSARLAREAGRVRLDSLLVTAPGGTSRLAVRGEVLGVTDSVRTDSLRVALAAEWRDLRWPLRGDTLFASPKGRARLGGRPASWSFDLDAALAAGGHDLGRWHAAGRGDTARVDLDSLRARPPGGDLGARGTLGWAPHPRWDLEVVLRNLDVGRFAPGWPGRIEAALRVTGIARDSLPDVDVRLSRLAGRLRGLALQGRGGFGFSRGVPHAEALAIGLGDARLALDGRMSGDSAIDGTLHAGDLGALVAGVGGSLDARFSLAGRTDAPRVRLQARGDSLAWPDGRAGSIALEASAGTEPDSPIALDFEAARVFVGGLPIERAALTAGGTAAEHSFDGSLATESETLWVAARGGLVRDRWSGALSRLDVRTLHAGTWRLAAPVPIALSPDSVAVDTLSLRSGGGRVDAAAGWSAAGSWTATSRIVHVPLALLDAWLPGGSRLEGSLGGSLTAGASGPAGPLRAELDLSQGPVRFIQRVSRTRDDTLSLGGGTLRATLGPGGAEGTVDLRLAGDDVASGRLRLPGFDALHPDTLNQPLEGRFEARLGDLGMLAAFVPGLGDARGRLEAAFDLGGTVSRPDVRGEAHLRNGRAGLPSLGITVTDVTLDATRVGGGRLSVEGSARSGEGRVKVTGDAELFARDGPRVSLAIDGSDFTAIDTRDARVKVNPQLTLSVRGERVDVGGQVTIPEARIRVNDALAQMPTPPSADVVFVGAGAETVSTGPPVHARVRVVLGDDVEIRLPGFRGKPTGSLLAIDEPGSATRGTGELTLNEGTYRAYGQDLVIQRGRLIFGGGPIADPGLDIRATRTASDGTVAGLQISGTVQRPILTVFSEPPMPDADAVSYIMFGRPLESAGKEGGLAREAATQLGVQGGDLLARSVAGKLGIEEAAIESSGSLQDASLFLGTWVSPRLYLSYGMGLFKPENTVRLRYSVSRHWAVQAESGVSQSGAIQYSGER